MSFRLRLFLAMLLLVAAVTGAALWIAERSMREAFARALEARFEERMARIERVREVRAEEARRMAGAITGSVRLQAALIEHAITPTEPPGWSIHRIAEVALGEEMRSSEWTLRLVDAQGRAIEGAEKLNAPGTGLGWRAKTPPLAALLAAGRERYGLLPMTQGPGWWEAHFTPVADLEDGGVLGGLLIAHFTDESGDTSASDMRPGLLLARRMVMGDWPPEAAAALAGLAVTARGRAEFPIGGVEHVIYWQRLGASDDGLFAPAVEVCAFTLAARARQQGALRKNVLAAGGAALAVAALVALALSNGLARPVRELVAVTQAIRRGDFTARATPRGGELGTLADAFNAMTGDLALKDTYRNMLDLVSDPHIAEDLIAGGLKLGGEERDVSVVFCDIRGFTALSEGMAPTAVIEMLNEHFTPLTRVVYEHGGVVLHFVGDLIIALFGAPRRSEATEKNAVACALGLVQERGRLNTAGERKIEVGVGVATGRVVAGRMGSKDRLNYSVFGARMNLAARLCSQAGPMQVLIDAPTLAGCGDTAQAEPLGALKLKGFTEEIAAFRLLALDSSTASA